MIGSVYILFKTHMLSVIIFLFIVPSVVSPSRVVFRDRFVELKLMLSSSQIYKWLRYDFVVQLNSNLDVQETHARGLYHKTYYSPNLQISLVS
jgi:hypothetical protein